MLPAKDPAPNVPVNYILDILGNVLFLQILRSTLAHIPIRIMNIPEVNLERITAFFQQVAQHFDPKILAAEKIPKGELTLYPKVILDYKTKIVIATAFPEEFCSEEEMLVQRFRENPSPESTILQMNNFIAKIFRIRKLYSKSHPNVQLDPIKFYAVVQREFGKAPISQEFVQFIIKYS